MGHCSPLNSELPPNSDLNAAYILEQFGPAGVSPWPDQELVSQVVNGVQFRAHMPLQIVMLPHLVSLPLGFTSVDKEVTDFVERGWYQRTLGLPFLPLRAMGQGAAARKSDPLRFRRTTDGGGPRKPAFDRLGIPAVSFNDAIGLHDEIPPLDEAFQAPHGTPRFPKWPASEVKPRIEDLMHDIAILRHTALTVFREPLVGFTDDFARYFTQFPVHPSEQWKTNLVWSFTDEMGSDGLDSSFSVVTEKRLGFGLSLSPSIAQRFSELVLFDFRSRLDAAEDAYFESILSTASGTCSGSDPKDLMEAASRGDGMSAACRWVQQRRALSRLTGRPELRLYTAHLYTDDIAVVVVGQARLIRALRCWEETTTAFGLVMAPPAKCQLGASFTWLGFNFHLMTGVVVAHPNKVSRARDTIDRALSGAQVTFDAYRSLTGLLEHLLPLVGGGRPWMYHMYGDNFRRGAARGPATVMVFGALQHASLRRWLAALLLDAGCSFSKALRFASVALPAAWLHSLTPQIPPKSLGPFSLFSDAARESSSGGLGGWVHGDWWHLSLTAEDRSIMHITTLEFVAAAINVIIFAPRLEGNQIYLYTDATSTVQVLISRAAQSPMLQSVHELLLATPEYAALAPTLSCDHVFGEVNAFADAASRNRPEVIQSLAIQVGVVARRIPLPPVALRFFEMVRSRARELQRPRSAAELEAAQQRGTAWPSTYTGDGPPSTSDEPDGKRLKDERSGFVPLPRAWPSARPRSPLQGSSPRSRPELPERSMATALVCSARVRSPTQAPIEPAIQPSEDGGPRPFSRPPAAFLPRPRSPLLLLGPLAVSAVCSLTAGRHYISLCASTVAPRTSGASPFHTPSASVDAFSVAPVSVAASAGSIPTPSFLLGLLDTATQQTFLGSLSPLAHSILQDDSAQALRPKDPSLLLEYDGLVGAAVAASVSRGTLGKNLLARRRWMQFTSLWGTAPLRDDDPRFHTREAFLVAAFLVWLSRTVHGKANRALAKPSTLMGMIYGVARDHHLHGRRFDCLHFAKLVVKALNDNYVQVYGSLDPRRREPFSGPLFRRILVAASSGVRLPFRDIPVLEKGSWFYLNFQAASALSRGGGFRRAEVSLGPNETFSPKHLSWASMFFIIDGVYLRYPSEEQLCSMRRPDKVGVLAGPCKNDRWGISFGAHPVYLPFDPEDPFCVGTILRNFAQSCRPPLSRLRSTPLFSATSGYAPLRHRHLDETLGAILASFLSPEECARYSWHSFRIGLACALMALGASDSQIMALVRWRSTAALRVYCRFEPNDYAAFIDAAAHIDAHSLQGPNLPALPAQPLPAPQPPVPGALPDGLYQLLDQALSRGPLEPDQAATRDLASRVPELDADLWVDQFSRLDLDRDPGDTAEELSDDE